MKYLLFIPLLLSGCLEVKTPKPLVVKDDSEAVSMRQPEPTATPKPKKEEPYVRGADRDIDEQVDGAEEIESVSDKLRFCTNELVVQVQEREFAEQWRQSTSDKNEQLNLIIDELKMQNAALRAQLSIR